MSFLNCCFYTNFLLQVTFTSMAIVFSQFHFNKCCLRVILTLSCVSLNFISILQVVFMISSYCGCRFSVPTHACVAPLHTTKVSFSAPFYVTQFYISLGYGSYTFLQHSSPFGLNRHLCHNLCCKCRIASFQLLHLEICVAFLLF